MSFDGASPSSSFPSLWLHPIHTSENGHATALVPINPEISSPKALANFAAGQVASFASSRKVDKSRTWKGWSHDVTLGGQSLLVADLKREESQVFDIPLLFAEVVACHLHSIGVEDMRAIAVGHRHKQISQIGCYHDRTRICGAFEAVWIIIVDGGDIALRCALASMGSLGAIRSDLHESYDVRKEPLGNGGYSTVHLAREKTPSDSTRIGIGVAVKIFLASSQGQAEDVSALVASEAEILLAAQKHPNIIGFHGIFSFIEGSTTRWALNLEWCPGGDLHDQLTAGGPCSEGQGAEILFGVLSGLTHMHARDLIHRDVKAENVLIMECGRPVLSDFGIASKLSDNVAMRKLCGSPGYVAPEVLEEKGYCTKADVFSTGVLLHFVLSGTLPFAGPNISSILRRTIRCRLKFESSVFRRLSDHMKKTMIVLMQKDPDDRLSSAAALEHTWSLYAVYLRDHAVWLGTSAPTPMDIALSSWSQYAATPHETNIDEEKISDEEASFPSKSKSNAIAACHRKGNVFLSLGDKNGVVKPLPTLLCHEHAKEFPAIRNNNASRFKEGQERIDLPQKEQSLSKGSASALKEKKIITNESGELTRIGSGSAFSGSFAKTSSSQLWEERNSRRESDCDQLEEGHDQPRSCDCEIPCTRKTFVSETSSTTASSCLSPKPPLPPPGKKPYWMRRLQGKSVGKAEMTAGASDVVEDPVMCHSLSDGSAPRTCSGVNLKAPTERKMDYVVEDPVMCHSLSDGSAPRTCSGVNLEAPAEKKMDCRIPRYQFSTAQSQPEPIQTKGRRFFRPFSIASRGTKPDSISEKNEDPATCPRQSFEDDVERRGWESWNSEASQRFSTRSLFSPRRSRARSFGSQDSGELDDDFVGRNSWGLSSGGTIMEDEIDIPKRATAKDFLSKSRNVLKKIGGFASGRRSFHDGVGASKTEDDTSANHGRSHCMIPNKLHA